MTTATDEELLQVLSHPTDFSVAQYLNLALQGHEQESDAQARLAELALTLQFQTTACHEEIGKLGAELRAIVPRCHADVGRLSAGLEGLQQDAAALQAVSQAALWGTAEQQRDQAPSSSLETLSTLHALQANLSRTREILTAAATWDETLASMPGLLAQGAAQLPAAVAQLATLVRGEQALRGMPDPESRTAALQRTRQQVAALLQPQLAHALQQQQTRLGPLQQCVQLYSQLDMLPQLEQAYVKHRPAALHKLWFDYQTPTPDSNSTAAAVTSASGNKPESVTSKFLAEWLPTWFEAVLHLLQEERRQAATVFGAAAVPSLMIQILSQAIRPVLGSFANRLASTPLPQIGRVYEACLQFTSLAYDLIATVYLDFMESQAAAAASPDSAPNAWKLWQDFETVVVNVLAQPLQTFQQNWAELEQKATKDSALPQARAELQEVLGRVQGLEQTSMEQIWQWLTTTNSDDDTKSVGMTTIVQQALGRFRLLRGGYGAPEAVSVLDELLALYIQQTTDALKPFFEACQTSDSYEDAHVTAALHSLRLAGWVNQEYGKLQGATNQELTVLQGRVEKHIRGLERLPADDDPVATSKFVLPDSLSTVEINSMLTLNAACSESSANKLELAQAALGTLEQLIEEKTLFSKAQKAVMDMAQTCHVFIFNVCFSVPRLHLAPTSGLDAWKKSSDSTDASSSYGTLPQSYITQVGEHVLSLVQALEPFATESPQALALVQPIMVNLRHVAIQPWKELLTASGVMLDSATEDKVVDRLMDGKDLLDMVVGPALEEEVEPDGDDDEENKDVTAFCNAWLDVVGLAVTGRLMERLLRIPNLTPKGCEHLQADLNYLVNVLMALGVQGHPHPLLGHMAELSMLDGDILLERIQGHDTREPLENCLASMEKRLAAMKGVH